jgi:LacI family transcriptional regulator
MKPYEAAGGTRAGVTISDVAVAANVSRATVSRVMNGRRVDPELTERVRRAAAELDYRPSALARSLSLGRTQAVGVVVPDLTNPMFQEVLRGIASGADAAGYGVVVAETQERPERELAVVRNTRSRVDALILVAPRSPVEDLTAFAAASQPVVLVNRMLDDIAVPGVSVDYAEAMFGAVEHLIDLGHRSIVFLSGPELSASNAERIHGFEAARASFGGVSFISQRSGGTIADGYGAAESVLATRATAVVANNDLVALGLLWRLRELGVSVPGTLSVLGFDDIELAQFGTPPLTTVSVPRARLGERAWSRLLGLMGDDAAADDPTTAQESSTELLATHLVVRQSTGPAPGAPVGRARRSDAAGDPEWRNDVLGQVLTSGDLRLARYMTGAGMRAEHSPRPYLHPVRALSGIRVTSATPADNRQHHGLSLALPNVSGTSFWGGRPRTRGAGQRPPNGYGRQVSRSGPALDPADPAALRDHIDWFDAADARLLTERRTVATRLVPGGWALCWGSEIDAVRDVVVSAPEPDVPGFGGIFWRFAPVDECTVAGADGVGPEATHGSASPWLSIALRRGQAWTTVVLIQAGQDRWFVRTEPYLAAGPCVAGDAPVELARGETLRLGLTALILDGLHTPAAVADRWYPDGAALFTPRPDRSIDTEDARHED